MRWMCQLGVVGLVAACGTTADPVVTDTDTEVSEPGPFVPSGPEPELTLGVQAGEPTLRRLTRSQYSNSIRDVFGDIVVPTQLELDVDVDGLVAVGTAVTAISTRGIEQYESAAFEVANQVIADDVWMADHVACERGTSFDEACMSTFIDEVGMSVWRRPLTSVERDRYLDVAEDVVDTLESFDEGVAFVIAGFIQSPNFLFREELGIEGQGGMRELTDFELASRLSYLLWNSTPDAELLGAASLGELRTEEGLKAQAERLLNDARAAQGVRAMFDDLYDLNAVPGMSKDPLIFAHMSATLGTSAREQTLRDLVWMILEEEGDFRDIFTTRTTHLDRELASVYGVQAPSRVGFARTTLPESLGRVGLFGQVSFLGLQAHPVSTSPTLRGKFLRERVLCHEIFPPPAGVDTSIPEPNPNAPTMRERLSVHLESPSCAACHEITDPVGLAFEEYDGLGRYRPVENGVVVDPSGDVDGEAFDDALGLAQVLREHPDVSPCLVDQTFRYATGRAPVSGEEPLLAWLTESYDWSGHRMKHLLLRLATSEGFRTVSPVEVSP